MATKTKGQTKAQKEQQKRTEMGKAKMLQALEFSLGIVSSACKAADIGRRTHYDWMEADPEYKKSVEELTEYAIDHVESKLFERVNGVELGRFDEGGNMITYHEPPNATAIIFYLKTKAKHRGYVERIEKDVRFPDGQNVDLTLNIQD